MTYQLNMDGETKALISHLSPSQKKKIKESLRVIAANPHVGKPLQEELVGFYSYRVGTLRIIYSINKSKRIISLVTLGPRRTIYDEVERSVSEGKHFGQFFPT